MTGQGMGATVYSILIYELYDFYTHLYYLYSFYTVDQRGDPINLVRLKHVHSPLVDGQSVLLQNVLYEYRSRT
jgi:hypothetical protein